MTIFVVGFLVFVVIKSTDNCEWHADEDDDGYVDVYNINKDWLENESYDSDELHNYGKLNILLLESV